MGVERLICTYACAKGPQYVQGTTEEGDRKVTIFAYVIYGWALMHKKAVCRQPIGCDLLN